MGHYSIAIEFYRHQTPRSAAEYLKWKSALGLKTVEEQNLLLTLQLFKWSVQYGATDIGGDVDVVTVDRGGIHWIRRKPKCEPNEIVM